MPPSIVHLVEAAGGGTGRHVVELARATAGRGYDVHVLYSDKRADAWFVKELDAVKNLTLVPLPMRRNPHVSDLAALLRLRSYLRKLDHVYAVHGHSSKGGALVCLSRLAGNRASRIYTPHAFRTLDPTLGRAARMVYGWLERAVIAVGCDALIAVSPEEEAHAQAQRMRPRKLVTIVNAVPRGELLRRAEVRRDLGIPDDQVVLGFIGRFSHQKAPERMIELMGRLQPDFPAARLVMVGDGELLPQLRQAAGSLPPGVVRILQDERAARLMAAFDLFVLPSRYEAMPYVLLEALAAALPIVTFDVGGVSVSVDTGVNGFVLPEGDTSAMAVRIGGLLRDSTLRAKMGQASRRKSLEFSLDRMVDSTLEVYAEANNGHES